MKRILTLFSIEINKHGLNKKIDDVINVPESLPKIKTHEKELDQSNFISLELCFEILYSVHKIPEYNYKTLPSESIINSFLDRI